MYYEHDLWKVFNTLGCPDKFTDRLKYGTALCLNMLDFIYPFLSKWNNIIYRHIFHSLIVLVIFRNSTIKFGNLPTHQSQIILNLIIHDTDLSKFICSLKDKRSNITVFYLKGTVIYQKLKKMLSQFWTRRMEHRDKEIKDPNHYHWSLLLRQLYLSVQIDGVRK